MHAIETETNASHRGSRDRRGSTKVVAVALLVAVTGIVGAVNYVVLSSFGISHATSTTTTNSTSTCFPHSAPQCRGVSAPSDAVSSAVMVAAAPH